MMDSKRKQPRIGDKSMITINGKEYAEINITDKDGGLLASITSDDVIEEDGIIVIFVPEK